MRLTPHSNLTEPDGLRVEVEGVVYQPNASTPPDRPHCFVYFICIHNHTPNPVTIMGRKWVVRNQNGQITAVEGDGVVGQFPTIQPGGCFRYNSFHLLDSNEALAEGSYLGVDSHGQRVVTRIPPFKMIVPPVQDSIT